MPGSRLKHARDGCCFSGQSTVDGAMGCCKQSWHICQQSIRMVIVHVDAGKLGQRDPKDPKTKRILARLRLCSNPSHESILMVCYCTLLSYFACPSQDNPIQHDQLELLKLLALVDAIVRSCGVRIVLKCGVCKGFVQHSLSA